MPLVPPHGRENQRGVVGAITLISAVLLSGARDGMIRQAGQPGNVLLAFAPTGRLDVHADELKRKAEGTADGR